MTEEFKEYKDSGYEVSNLGRVRHGTRFIKPWNNTSAKYFQITCTKDGKKRKPFLHRMVAELFVPNVDGKPEVDHIDGNPYNNRADNLRWVTSSENKQNRTPELRYLTRFRKRCSILQIDPKTNIAIREWTRRQLKASEHKLDYVLRCCSTRDGGSYHGFRWQYMNRQMSMF